MESAANNRGAPRYSPSAFMGFLQLLLIVVVFAVVGPVVGTIVIATLKGLIDGSLYGLAEIPGSIILGLVTGAGHAIGGLPAAVAGLMVGIKQAFGGGAGWRFALCVGVLIGIPVGLVFRDLGAMAGPARAIGAFCIVTTLSTLACWRIVSTWSFVREANP